MNLAVIGLGNWGKKLLIEFNKSNTITACYTTGNRQNLNWLKNNFPKIRLTKNINKILNDNKIDAVIIASPIITHKNLVHKSLLKEKHVFVEKPLSKSVSESKFLVKLAKKKKRCLFVGNIFLYHPVFQKLKNLLVDEKIKSISGTWLKTGTFKEDILFNLLYHEISIIQELIGKQKKILIENSKKFVSKSDIIDVNITYANKINCHFHIDRISTIKHKSLTIITDKNCYLWENDTLFKFSKHTSKYIKVYNSKQTALEIECKLFIRSLSQKYIKFDNTAQSLEIIKTLCKVT